MKKNIALLAITVIVMAVFSELFLWLVLPVADPYRIWKEGQSYSGEYIPSQFPANEKMTFYPEPGLSNMSDKARFSTNNVGFRGDDVIMPKPADEFRIFMVGGSTTECLYLDDTLAITAQLESYLQSRFPDSMIVKVYNAGKSGDRTYDHIAMISQRILHLNPDMIIVFCGINDLTAAIYGADYLHRQKMYSKPISMFDLIKFFLTEFQLPRRAYYAYKGLWGEQLSGDLETSISFKSDYKAKAQFRRSIPVSDSMPVMNLPAYRMNLLSLIGLARAHKVRLVFMTQAATWNSKSDPGISQWIWGTYKDGINYSEANLSRALSAYNDVLRQVAAKEKVPVFDTDLLIPKTLEYFYDDCHFNNNGSQKAAALLGSFLLENGLCKK